MKQAAELALAALVAEVDARCRTALANATDARATGRAKRADAYEAQAGRLLDRLNDLELRLWTARRKVKENT